MTTTQAIETNPTAHTDVEVTRAIETLRGNARHFVCLANTRYTEGAAHCAAMGRAIEYFERAQRLEVATGRLVW